MLYCKVYSPLPHGTTGLSRFRFGESVPTPFLRETLVWFLCGSSVYYEGSSGHLPVQIERSPYQDSSFNFSASGSSFNFSASGSCHEISSPFFSGKNGQFITQDFPGSTQRGKPKCTSEFGDEVLAVEQNLILSVFRETPNCPLKNSRQKKSTPFPACANTWPEL